MTNESETSKITASSVQSDFPLFFQKARENHRNGHLTEAIKLYQQCLTIKPDHFDSPYFLAVALYQSGKKAESLAYFNIAASLNPRSVDAHKDLGLVLKELKRFDDALASFERAIRLKPDHAELYVNQGIVLKELNRVQDAILSYDKALRLKPNFAEAHNNRGNALASIGQHDEAIISYETALALKPNFADAKYNCGVTLRELKRFGEALIHLDDAIALKPKYAEAYCSRGIILKELKRHEEALASYDSAIALKPDYAEVYYNRGNMLRDLKRFDAACDSYNKAIALKPDYAEAYLNRGITLKELKRHDEALASYDSAIALKPDYAGAYLNRGITLKELKRHEEALASYDSAIALKTDYAEAYYNRGNMLRDLKQVDAAHISYDKAIALKPDYVEAYCYRGNMLKDLKQVDAALINYDKAIALKPDYAEAFWSKSLSLLLQGKFREGWELYEWRWKSAGFDTKPLLTNKPLFSLGDKKRVLLWAEQGVGDEIMFGSLISGFRHLCAQLIVQMDARLIPIFSRSISKDVVFYPKECLVPQDSYDQHIPVGSIGRYLRNNEESFIATRSGYLIADNGRTNEIKKFLTNNSRRKVCGISWRSKNEKSGNRRSLTLTNLLEPLFMNEYAFVNLQYGDTTEEINQARIELGIDVTSCDQVDNFNDLDGLASLVQACDVVVSVDNTTVHLAGALGKDVRILLPGIPDWRWQLDREDTPWYSSATLYRQDADGDWANAFSRIKSDLRII